MPFLFFLFVAVLTVFDTQGDRLVMFGGEYFDNKKNIFYNELLELDIASGRLAKRPAY
jgi:hypothetical protein